MRRLFSDYLLFVAIVVAANLLLFYSGFYGNVCAPDSYAGNVYIRMALLRQIEEHHPQKVVALLGDSTTEEGIRSKQLSEHLRKPVANLALPGTSPLEWLYFLRAVDPHRSRFEIVVITLTPHNMRTVAHEEGFQSLLPVSGPALLAKYASFFPRGEQRLGYYYASFERFYAFRDDLRDLLLNRSRLRDLSETRNAHIERIRQSIGPQSDVCDVQMEASSGRVLRWGSIKDREIRKLAQNALNRTNKLNAKPVVTGILKPIEDILRFYENSDTRIVLVSIPFGMHHQIQRGSPAIANYFQTLKRLSSLPNVEHWDATELPLFKDCRNYYEFRHLNAQARTRFSKVLSQFLQGLQKRAVQ